MSNAAPSSRAKGTIRCCCVVRIVGAADPASRGVVTDDVDNFAENRAGLVAQSRPTAKCSSAATASPMMRRRSASISAGCHVTPKALRFSYAGPARDRQAWGHPPRAASDTAQQRRLNQRAEGRFRLRVGQKKGQRSQPRTSLVLASSATVFSPLGSVTGERPPPTFPASVAARTAQFFDGGWRSAGPPSQAAVDPFAHES